MSFSGGENLPCGKVAAEDERSLNFGLGEGGARLIINKLECAGYSCYFAGGCVRDALLALPVNDIDLATNASPNEVKRVFSGYSLDLKGENFGTVGVIVDKNEYEITTFRKDGNYKDLRKPLFVSFESSMKTDAARRDFTCNALYYGKKTNGCEGLIDFFGGEGDAKQKILRAVGEAEKRFSEDALRVLRALRFCSTLGFKIEKSTKAALFKYKEGVKSLSPERVYSELKKMILGKFFCEVYSEYYCVLAEALPEIVGFDNDNCARAEIIDSTENTEITHGSENAENFKNGETGRWISVAANDFCVRFALLFENLPYKNADLALKRLKADKRSARIILGILKNRNACFSSEQRVKNTLNGLGEELCFAILNYKKALANPSELLEIKKQELLLKFVIKNGGYSLKTLAVNGNDLIPLGVSGKASGVTLKKLLTAVINGEVANEKAELIAFVKKDTAENKKSN